MIRGTTAQFAFDIPYDFSELEYVNIFFWQEDYYGPSESRALPIKLHYDANNADTDLEYLKWTTDNRRIVVTLIPEQTARFTCEKKAIVQLSATTKSGIRFASDQQIKTVYPIHDDCEFSDKDVVKPPEIDGYIILDGGNAVS